MCGLGALLQACKPSTPGQFIQPGEMEELLIDYHRARALADRHLDGDTLPAQLYVDAVLKKHGVTKELFDSSLVFYYRHADRFDAIYKRVAERLEQEALVLGASESDIGKYASLDIKGDTANIWNERTTRLLLPRLPYNRWEFSIAGDSLFRTGDELLLQMMVDYMYQDGAKSAVAYLSVDYADTVVSRNIHFSSSGLSQLRFSKQPKAGKPKRVRGFIYLDGANEATTTTRLLFLSQVQLIRFHTQKEDDDEHTDKALPQDSLQRDSLGRRLANDTVGGGDTLRRKLSVLPTDTGVASHGVAARNHLNKAQR